MSFSFEALTGTLGMDSSGWNRGFATAQQSLEVFRGRTSKVFADIEAFAGKAAVAFGAFAAAAGAIGSQLVSVASNAEEAASKFSAVFGTAADKAREAIDTFADAAGRSRHELRGMAADIGAILGPMGFSVDKTAELSAQLVQLAEDIASFANTSSAEAMTALRSGIVGETEPLRRFGVVLNEAKIEAEAFALGIATTKEEIQGAVKAQAVMSIIMKETTTLQNDAVRTASSYANTLRRVRGLVHDLSVDIGGPFKDAATQVLSIFADLTLQSFALVPAIVEVSDAILSVENVSAVFSTAGEAVNGFADAVSRLVDQFAFVGDSFTIVHSALAGLTEVGGAFFNSLPQWAQDLAIVGGTFTAISAAVGTLGGSIPFVGGLFTSLASLINPISILTGGFGFLANLAGMLTAALGLVASAVAAIITPAGLVVAGIAAIGLAINEALATSEEARAKLAGIWEAVNHAVDVAWQTVEQFVDTALTMLSSWWTEHAESITRTAEKWGTLFLTLGAVILEKLGPPLRWLTEFLRDVTLGVLQKVLDFFGWIVKGAEAVAGMFRGDFRRAFVFLNETIAWVVESLASMLRYLGDAADLLPWFGEQVSASMKDAAIGMEAYARSLRAATEATNEQLTAEEKAEAMRRANEEARKAAAAGGGQAIVGPAPQSQQPQPAAEPPTVENVTVTAPGPVTIQAAATPQVVQQSGAAGVAPAARPGKAPEESPLEIAARQERELSPADRKRQQAEADKMALEVIRQRLEPRMEMTRGQQNSQVSADMVNFRDRTQQAAGADGATVNAMRQLVELQNKAIGLSKAVRDTTGDARKANLDSLAEVEAAYTKLFKAIEDGSAKSAEKQKADMRSVADESKKSAGSAAADARKNLDAPLGQVGAMANDLSNIMSGATKGIAQGQAMLADFVSSVTSPLQKLDLAIQAKSAEVGMANLNTSGLSGGRGASLDAVSNLTRELSDLQKRRMAVLQQEADERMAAEKQQQESFAKRQVEKREAERSAAREAGLDIVALVGKTGNTINIQKIDAVTPQDLAEKLAKYMKTNAGTFDPRARTFRAL